VAIPGCQFIREMRQAISIRYVSMRIAINFIENTRIGILRIMHPFGGGAIIRALINKDYFGVWFARITHEGHSPFAYIIPKALF
jgi:hypothetical protein